MTDLQIIQTQTFPIKIALSCFAIGTLVFIALLLLPDETAIFMAGASFALLAALLHLLLLIFLLFKLLFRYEKSSKIVQEMLYLLANFPIAGLYFFIIINHNSLF